MFRTLALPVALALSAMPVVASAQQRSPSYEFLEAVRGEDGDKVTQALQQSGPTVIDTRDRSTGETALHIVARKGNLPYLRFLLSKGANANAQDGQGTTAALIAAERGWTEALDVLVLVKANMNLANSRGEPPLIRAVQTRNLEAARLILSAGGNPDKADVIAGMSARDYARADTRTPALRKLLDEAPKAAKAANAAGPQL